MTESIIFDPLSRVGTVTFGPQDSRQTRSRSNMFSTFLEFIII